MFLSGNGVLLARYDIKVMMLSKKPNMHGKRMVEKLVEQNFGNDILLARYDVKLMQSKHPNTHGKRKAGKDCRAQLR
ncbi:hypothetical protein CEXT_596351 [Caerostris extrusa]|uniref:Uncharacterized protein n=1 Tax=Caerostris extrusa TaxID=172846 RepID=A0AAV4TGF9_CAEEX|nr:hypothetical protein CEXT_596351 [Caerostris extrusa]